MGIQIDEHILYAFLFTDDQVLISMNEKYMSFMIRKLVEAYKEWGLEVNIQKIKCLVIRGVSNYIWTEEGYI